MEKKNQYIWFYTLQFLSVFRSLKYDKLPIALLILRDFQKYICSNRKRFPHKSSLALRSMDIQKQCQPVLIRSNLKPGRKGYTLVRAEMYPITKGNKDDQFLFLAHHLKEYQRMKKNKKCRPLLFLGSIPEYKPLLRRDKKVYQKLKSIFSSSSTPKYFKTKSFQVWLKRKTAYTLKRIRRIHTLFSKYPICKTIYGSTINRHGVLVTSFAQSRGILTINIQHGMFGEVGHLPVNADLNLVWGESHTEYLAKFGAPEDRFRVAIPTFVRSLSRPLPVNEPAEQDQNRSSLNVLVAMQPLGERYNTRMIQQIEEAALATPYPTNIGYKLHPDQGSGRRYNKWIRSKYSQILPHTKKSLSILMNNADIIITPYSSVAFEGLLQQKPILFYGKSRDIYYVKDEPAFICTSSQIRRVFTQHIQMGDSVPSLVTSRDLKDSLEDLNEQDDVWVALKRYLQKEEVCL